VEHQRFIRESRFNLRVTPTIMRCVPGLFHITTDDAWGAILRDGIKPGAQLPPVGRNEGRCDIHLLTAHPVKDQLQNRRLTKMWNKGYMRVVVVSLLPSAIDLDTARINQQGVVMQRTPISPSTFDYACVIDMNSNPYEFTCLFLGGISEQVSTIHTIGSPYSEWIDTFKRNLAICGYHGPIGTTAADRWALAHRYRNHNIFQDSTANSLEKMRCPRCLNIGCRGVTTCPICTASFALEKNTGYTFTTGTEVRNYVVHGKALKIWVPSSYHKKSGSVVVEEPSSVPRSDPLSGSVPQGSAQPQFRSRGSEVLL